MNHLKTAGDVVRSDLDNIVSGLTDELDELRGRHFLVAGGAGFLGYYLVQAALHLNRLPGNGPATRVTVLDNFIRGVPAWLEALESDSHLTTIRHDIRNPLPGDLADVDYLIHAASIASPTFYRRYPIETMEANVDGLRHLLDYCVRRQKTARPVRGMLFYSSSEIYGDPTPENIPTPESYRGLVSCTGPRACYDESKRFGETLCVNFAAQRGVPVKVARPFNNYGPGLKITDRRVIPDFARNIFAGEDIVMLSDGTARRTFCYATDAITGYYKILVRGGAGEAYNIGVETPEISMGELATKLATLGKELVAYPGSIVHRPSDDQDYLVDNPNRRCPIIDKARTELGYDPKIPLEEGLYRTLVWYSGNREAADA